MQIRPIFLVVSIALAPASSALAESNDTPPTTPAGPSARAYDARSGGIAWRRSIDDRGVRGYAVSRDGKELGVFDSLSYVDRDLSAGTVYRYAIAAVDSAGQRSGRATVRLTTPDAPPQSPAGLRVSIYSSTAAGLAWQRSGIPGERYEVRRDGVTVATTADTSHIDTGLTDRRRYLFEVIAVNRQGKRSASARLFVHTGRTAPPVDVPPVVEPSVIGADHHVDLLKHVFDIYTGNAYGPAVLDLPGFSGTPDFPNGPPGGDPFVESVVCGNGGTAESRHIRSGDFVITEGWLFDFDNCQDGSNVLDGKLSNADNGADKFVSSTGFTRDTPLGQTRFRGNVDRLYRTSRGGDYRNWNTTLDSSFFGPNAYDPDAKGVSFVVTDTSGTEIFELLEARTDFGYYYPTSGSLSGSFTIMSETTWSERLNVSTLEPFIFQAQDYPENPAPFPAIADLETGILQVSTASGDTLVLDADTGDSATVRIEITIDGHTETLIQPWSLWSSHLDFTVDFLGGQ